MKLNIKAASALLAATAFFAQTAGAGTIAPDKWMHIGGTATVASATSYIFKNEPNRFWLGVGAGMAVGLAKELSDSRAGGSGFSNTDLAADLVGSVLGAYFVDSLLKPTVSIDSHGKPFVGMALTLPLH